MDRCWHGLKLSGASGHTTMNAGFVVMTMITMMMVMIRRKARTMVMGSLFGFPKHNHKTESGNQKGNLQSKLNRDPKMKTKEGTNHESSKGFPK